MLQKNAIFQESALLLICAIWLLFYIHRAALPLHKLRHLLLLSGKQKYLSRLFIVATLSQKSSNKEQGMMD
jgi:hypothetical protein